MNMKFIFTSAVAVLVLGLGFSSAALAGIVLIQADGGGFGDVVGAVDVTDDGATLSVVFTTNGDFRLTEVHADVALDDLNCSGIPQTGSGNPKVGKFEDEDSAALPGSTELTLTLDDVFACDALLCIAAHAVVYDTEVICGDNSNEDQFACSNESAWGDGDDFDGRNWATFFEFQKSDC